VNQVIVDDLYKSKGIGRRLMEEAEKIAIKLDADALDLYVMETNDIAKRIYDSLNYQTEKRYMVKRLKEIK